MPTVQSEPSVLTDRYRNKGTAFTSDERDRLGLHGLLPATIETLDLQLERVLHQYDALTNELDRYDFLRSLQELNSVLFYAFLQSDLEKYLPVIYTPTVGAACSRWSDRHGIHHGLYLSWPNRNRIEQILEATTQGRPIDLIVATNGERVLGLGDLGAGGMGISIGKLAIYSAVGGVNPATTLPVQLDAGTDNEDLLANPLYLGWRHRRVRGEQFDELVDNFVTALRKFYPHAVLQWEDFATADAERLLQRHRHSVSSFNDDIQGTATVTTAAILRGLRASKTPIAELRAVIVGAGSAGCGIANTIIDVLCAEGLTTEEAKQRCWLVDRDGLVHDGLSNLTAAQKPLARSQSEAQSIANGGSQSLAAVVNHARPHALVGVCAQPKIFSKEVVLAQARHIERPIVLPLSNPNSRAEAVPADVLNWTDGRALIGTGSPTPDITIRETTYKISQVNNVYAFPGIGLGAIAAGAPTISKEAFLAATDAIARFGTDHNVLLPPIARAPEVCRAVAHAVSNTIDKSLLNSRHLATPISDLVWEPKYRPA